MYEVAGPGAEERGPPGFRLCSDSLQKVEQTERRDNAGIMRILITEPGGETERFVIAVTDISRVTTRVDQKTSARVRHYVWAAALEPTASRAPIVQAFHRGHRARAITHSSKRLCNRKYSWPSHFHFEILSVTATLWLQVVTVQMTDVHLEMEK